MKNRDSREGTKTRSSGKRVISAAKRKYKPYPKYKDSGVEWLKQIPAHWGIKRGKYLFQKMSRPVRPEDEIVTAFRDGQVTLRRNRREDGFTNAEKEIGYQGVRCGDLVIHAMDAFAGAIGVSDSDGKSTPVYSVCTPVQEYDANAYFYCDLLREMASNGYILALAKGIRERSTDFRYADFGALFFLHPNFSEQTAIADFIERECGRMDKLVEKKQEFIALLKEKRQALITHAVTKGLDPKAAMKDSGVEWLGKVPKHWDVKRLKYLVRMPLQYGANESGELPTEGWPRYIRITDIDNSTSLYEDGIRCLAPEVAEPYLLDDGDLLLARSGATAGKSFQYKASHGPACFAGYLIRAAINKNRFHPTYIQYFMESSLYWAMIGQTTIQSTIQNVGAERYGDLSIPIPLDQGEQIQIINHIDRETTRIDRLIAKTIESIDLLKERKTALITAAVTGQIDVSQSA